MKTLKIVVISGILLIFGIYYCGGFGNVKPSFDEVPRGWSRTAYVPYGKCQRHDSGKWGLIEYTAPGNKGVIKVYYGDVPSEFIGCEDDGALKKALLEKAKNWLTVPDTLGKSPSQSGIMPSAPAQNATIIAQFGVNDDDNRWSYNETVWIVDNICIDVHSSYSWDISKDVLFFIWGISL